MGRMEAAHSTLTNPSPIAFFAFRRPVHTRRALEALAKNAEFALSPLFIYCDGPRDEEDVPDVQAVRALVRQIHHPQKTIIESDHNRGLADSVVRGVTELCAKFGRVTVVEDDLVVSPFFLNFVNRALDHYSEEHRVMQVSGHMYSIDLAAESDALFLPFTTSWGWGTWQRAWKHYDDLTDDPAAIMNRRQRIAFDLGGAYPYYHLLRRAMRGGRDSWAIKWYLSVFRLQGLVLYPSETLVANEGFDGSGTHCRNERSDRSQTPLRASPIAQFPRVAVSQEGLSHVKRFLKKQRGAIRRMVDWPMRLI